MSSPYTLKVSQEQAKEMPMVDLAFNILKAANTPFYYRDLMNEIAKIKGISDQEVMEVIAQLYTEINIDGRFACVGTNLWGLKRWYPLEKAEDPVGNVKRPRIINDEDDDLDDEDDDLFADDSDDSKYHSDGDDEDFDAVDEDSDEIFDDESDDEVDEDDEDLDDEELDSEDEDSEDDEHDSDDDYDDIADRK